MPEYSKRREAFSTLVERGISIPSTTVVQISIDIPEMAMKASKYPAAPIETIYDKEDRDSCSKFFLDFIYRMAWTTVDSFGENDSDPRLEPLLDLLEVMQRAKGRC